MKFRLFCLICVICFAFTSTGFVCSTRVEKMEADIEALQIQFNDVQKRLNNDQTQLTSMILRADKKLEELGGAQDQSTNGLAQQNVQLALDLEKERAEMAEMRGRLEVQQKTIDTLQTSLQSIMSNMSSTSSGNTVLLPSDQPGLALLIEQKRLAGDKDTLKTAITEYLTRYPDDAQIEAMLAELTGLTLADRQNHETITYSTQYLQKFPKGAHRNDVIYNMGQAGLAIGNCDLAIQSFETLKTLNYAQAPAALENAKAKCKK